MTPILVNAQFSHRVEVLIENALSTQSYNTDYFDNNINYRITGGGIKAGIKYNFRNIPVGLLLGYENSIFSKYSVKSNIDISDDSYKLNVGSVDLDIQYLFFKKSVYKPFIFIGMNYSNIDLRRENLIYSNIKLQEKDYSHQIDEVNFGTIQSNINTLGINAGAGINVRLSDMFGITGNVRLRYIPQNKTEWLSNKILIYTCSIGLYVRLLKDKNNM